MAIEFLRTNWEAACMYASSHPGQTIGGAAVAIIAVALTRLLSYSFPERKPTPERGDPTKKVIFHCLHRTGSAVTPVSPFVGKLLTFLRLNPQIPFEVVVADFRRAPKGKVPFIVHGDNMIGDSQLIIGYLTRTFLSDAPASSVGKAEVPLYVPWHRLSAQEQGISTLVTRTLEDHFYWGGVYWRWARKTDDDKNWLTTVRTNFGTIPAPLRWLFVSFLRKQVKDSVWAQGLARHNDADMVEMLQRDVDAAAAMLGDKPFFTGNNPTECDCSAFAALEQATNNAWDTPFGAMITKHSNLVAYIERMKTSVFADLVANPKMQPWHKNKTA